MITRGCSNCAKYDYKKLSLLSITFPLTLTTRMDQHFRFSRNPPVLEVSMNERYCKDWIGTNCWISWTWEQELFLSQLSLDNPTVRLANDVCVCQKYRKNMEFYPGTVFPSFLVKVNLASNHVTGKFLRDTSKLG